MDKVHANVRMHVGPSPCQVCTSTMYTVCTKVDIWS